MTPLGALLRGTLAGAVGTAAMDAFWYARYRRQGGTDGVVRWEFGGPDDWEHVSAPAHLGRRLYEGFTQRTLDARFARLTNNVMHWGYGVAWGGALGVVAASLPHARAVHGPVFGTGVWLSSYVTLPLAGLYKPIWRYGIADLAPDLVAHLAYGTVTERTVRLVSHRGW